MLFRIPALNRIRYPPFIYFSCHTCLFMVSCEAKSSFDFNWKIKVLVGGQKATDSRSDEASLVEGHDADLHFPPGLGVSSLPAAVH